MSMYTKVGSPVGELLLVGEQGPNGTVLRSLSMAGGKGAAIQQGWTENAAAFTEIVAQLDAYFAGDRTHFDIEYATGGTDFQQRVWKALEQIPYGATVSYGDIAAQIGASRAAVRAVGTAIGANPVLIIRPCHRVVGADGSLTGYAGGVERKQQLLDLESARRAA